MQELNYLMKTTPDNLDRRAMLIKQLKEAQHNLMNVIFAITKDAVPDHHTCRDFRAKYPDDVLVDQINGECTYAEAAYKQPQECTLSRVDRGWGCTAFWGVWGVI